MADVWSSIDEVAQSSQEEFQPNGNPAFATEATLIDSASSFNVVRSILVLVQFSKKITTFN